MSDQRATITYTAPASFLSSDHWKQVHAALLCQLPLRNLHWKPSTRPTIRTIQELNVNFIPADSVRDEHTSQIPQSLLERPLLNAYVVICEDTETYRTTVKKQIKDWHTSIVQRKNQEWLIIHIVRPESKATGARLFQVKATVLDKIKADFNVEKRDRCVQLVWASDYDNPAAWAELIGKVKDGLLSAFDGAVSQREEEVRRSEGQRQMPGWNFCTYFILKESLAASFEGMSLLEEALGTYEELEALFFQILRDRSLTWFGTLANPSARDDSTPLLSITRKPYRDLILANAISIQDFRIYLLARQCGILNGLGRVVEVGRRVVTFLQSFGRRLRDVKELPPYFIESWTYSSALNVVDQCDSWAKSLTLDKATLPSFNATKGELVELARHQLDALGIAAGFLPFQPPFSNALPGTDKDSGSNPPKANFDRISRADLKSALEDKEVFYEMYVALTNRAIELFASAGRRKFALRMHGSLAALDVVRGRLATALQTYTSLPAHYAPHEWTSLEAFMLTRSLDLHATTEKPKDKDWISILLEFLKAYVQDLGKALLINTEDHIAYTTSLVKSLKGAAADLDTEVTFHDHPVASISVPSDAIRLAEDKDGALLRVVVNNHLPCDLLVDEINVTLAGRENERLLFSGIAHSFTPGSNTVTLFCPSASAGTYLLHSSQVKLAKLVLQWLHMSPTGTKSHKRIRQPTLISIPKDVRSLDIRLRQPRRIEIGKPATIILELSTGRNVVSKAMLRLSVPSGVQLYIDKTSLEGDEQEASLEIIDGSIVLFDIASNNTIALSVPHSDASAFHALRVSITADYVTVSEPELTRTLRLSRTIVISLPLAINVENFFRGTRLFVRFTLSTTTHQYIRIKSTELSPDGDNSNNDDLKISKSMAQTSRIVTVTPTCPGRFLFQLDSQRGHRNEFLFLHITYRMLREEVKDFIDNAVKESLGESASRADHDILLDALVRALENDGSWVELYGITGELIVPNVDCPHEHLREVLNRAVEILRRGCSPEENKAEWREIVIRDDVPRMHILAGAHLRILPNPFGMSSPADKSRPLYAGQPISAMLSITTSFHWAPTEDINSKTYNMRFDVEEITKDWLVSGRKRGDFVAKDGTTFETSITLIALHHGELALPKIAVTALPINGEDRMRSVVVPSCATHQVHGAETVLILPRGGRTTFVVDMGENPENYQY